MDSRNQSGASENRSDFEQHLHQLVAEAVKEALRDAGYPAILPAEKPDPLNQLIGKKEVAGKLKAPEAALLKPRAVKIKEAAVLLGVGPKTVRRLIDREQLRAVRTLRHLLVPISEIERFLNQ